MQMEGQLVCVMRDDVVPRCFQARQFSLPAEIGRWMPSDLNLRLEVEVDG
jgi:hypothetical protein